MMPFRQECLVRTPNRVVFANAEASATRAAQRAEGFEGFDNG